MDRWILVTCQQTSSCSSVKWGLILRTFFFLTLQSPPMCLYRNHVMGCEERHFLDEGVRTATQYVRAVWLRHCRSEFQVQVGLHLASVVASYLITSATDGLSDKVKWKSWKIVYADDKVICSENPVHVKKNLKRWRWTGEDRETWCV